MVSARRTSRKHKATVDSRLRPQCATNDKHMVFVAAEQNLVEFDTVVSMLLRYPDARKPKSTATYLLAVTAAARRCLWLTCKVCRCRVMSITHRAIGSIMSKRDAIRKTRSTQHTASRQRRLQATCTNDFVKFVCVVSEICERTRRQTSEQTDIAE